MSSAIAALIGTGIGGAISVLTALLAARSQRRQHEDERRNELTDLRREACVAYLDRIDPFIEAMRQMDELLAAKVDGPEFDAQAQRYLKAWQRANGSSGPVQINGPEELSEAAHRLGLAVAAYSRSIDEWTQRRRRPSGLKAAWDDMQKSRSDFIALSRALLAGGRH